MKSIVDYNNRNVRQNNNRPSGKLYEARQNKRVNHRINTLCESAYDDIVENARELHNDKELAKVMQKSMEKGKPLAIWAYPGNGILNAVKEVFDNADLEYNVYSARDRFVDFIDDINNGVNNGIVILSELTRINEATMEQVMPLIGECIEEGIYVVALCNMDAANNDLYGDVLKRNFDNVLYSPQYDRVTYYDDDAEEDVMDDFANESVSQKFAKYRKLYESDDDDAPTDAPADDNSSNDAPTDAPADDNNDADNADDNNDGDNTDDTEDVPMTAIILTVAKDDADKCKDEMVEAGISEDGIEILDAEDDEDNRKIRVDADYALELKDYLAGKGIDLEEKIGGEIVDDSDTGDDAEGDKKDGEGDDTDTTDGDTMDDDALLNDLFGDDTTE